MLLLIDKPKGISSFDVIRRLRQDFKAKGEKPPKMGHAGTLDPRASGLMLVATDADTKQLHGLTGLDKEYIADVVFGVRTDTGDLDGAVIAEEECSPSLLTEERIAAALQTMATENSGRLTLPVSLYSAMKRKGRPLYEYAREGIAVTAPLREMRILKATLLEYSSGEEGYLYKGKKLPCAKVCFLVESGTYIRSLAEELGKRVANVPASLAELRRTKVGIYSIDESTIVF